MDNAVLELLNKSALKLLTTQSLEALCTVIVDEAKKLSKADRGGVFLLKKKKLEKIYMPSTLLLKPDLKKKSVLDKALKTHAISIFDTKEIPEQQTDKKAIAIKWLTIIPLPFKNGVIGMLALESSKEEKISESERHALQLFGSMASLAITKIQLTEEMQRTVELRDRFISLASHELRTPLTSLNGYIQLLHNKMANKNTIEARWTEDLYRECNRLTTLVKDLLDINRIKQGQLAFVFSEVSMADVASKAIEKLRYLHNDRTIILENINPNNTYTVVGDQEKLLEMVSALLMNAVKFSKSPSKVFISLSHNKRNVRIKITDEGKGIPRQDLDGIFEGFYKTKHSKDKEGMGVGLLLAKHVIKIHKGKIMIDSNENKGTKVTVDLPSVK